MSFSKERTQRVSNWRAKGFLSTLQGMLEAGGGGSSPKNLEEDRNKK